MGAPEPMWRVSYEGRWFGAVYATTADAALRRVRKMNPHHKAEGFAVGAKTTLDGVRKEKARG